MNAPAIKAAFDAATEHAPEPPRPLVREMAQPGPFPVDALGVILAEAARAIQAKTQAPLAICCSSVLAAASLAAQAHADVELPTGQVKPLSLFLVSVAASGERKSTVDGFALWPIRKHEATLRTNYEAAVPAHANAAAAHAEARARLMKDKKKGREELRAALDALGPEPPAPLLPLLTADEPTAEGMVKLLAAGQPAIGLFSAEGGLFLGGHALAEEARLRTAATLALAWDGEPLRRVRAGDGAIILPGRRVALHLMAQPDVAAGFLTNPVLADQGLLARILVTAPATAAGSRLWRDPPPEADAGINRYCSRLLALLETPLPLAPLRVNELAPRVLPLSSESRTMWIAFSDHVERAMAPGESLEPIRAFAAKAGEHAARVAGVLALVADPQAQAIQADEMAWGIEIAQHFMDEALRLALGGKTHPDLRLAQTLLDWLCNKWSRSVVSTADIYRLGPNGIRDKSTAKKAINVLVDHGWLVSVPGGAEIDGIHRKEVWRLVR